jgi:serralysin
MSSISVSDFLNSIGVNTHLDFSSAYSNTALVEAETTFLGVKNVRDAMASPFDASLFGQFAAATGVKFDVYLTSGQSYDKQISQIVANLGFVRFAEGINESDTWAQSYKGLSGFAATAAVQQALYTAVKASGTVPVIAPSYGILSSFSVAPNASTTSNYGNTHEYFGTGNPPTSGISSFIANANIVSGSAPVVATEAGYYTGASLASGPAQFAASGVDEAVQAKYDLTVLFDDWKMGVSVTYLYELMDNQSDPNNTDFRWHYGLFNPDGTPKLAATAIHNLTYILADGGSSPRSGDVLGYQITGMPSTGNSLLMEKSNGTFDLTLWNDIRLWSATSPTEVNSPLPPIVLDFGQIVRSVMEYDPLVGTGPVAAWSNVHLIGLYLPDHPVIFEVTLYPPGQLSLANYVTPTSLLGGASTGNMWAQILANAVETNPNWVGGLSISAVQTSGSTGTVTFDSVAQTLIYTAPAYNALNPTDSFTYTVTDGHGGSVTGTVAVTELPAANTVYAATAGASYSAASTGLTMISLAAGQTFRGNAAGGDSFIVNIDTKVYAPGSNNTIHGGNGNLYAGAGADNAHITLGDGNNTISVTGVGAVVTTGNGNNVVWKPTGSATITMGNGNQNITAGGRNNLVSIGTGTSIISLGADGLAAGNERATVAGGTNTITVGGANDMVHILGGNGNKVIATGGQATIIAEAGGNTFSIQGAANTVTASGGTNIINTNGASNIIHGGTGSDTIWAGSDYNLITAGLGRQTITVAGHHDTIDFTSGTDTLTENGSGNTIVLAAPGGPAAQIYGNVIALNDIFDFRHALAATAWADSPALPDYLRVRVVGATSIISIDADGTGPSVARDIAVLNNSANLTYQGLIAHAITI